VRYKKTIYQGGEKSLLLSLIVWLTTIIISLQA